VTGWPALEKPGGPEANHSGVKENKATFELLEGFPAGVRVVGGKEVGGEKKKWIYI